MANTNGTATRAALYLRKSTDRQEDSIERQRAGVLAYCRQKGYRVEGEPYIDEGISGDEFGKRSGFQRLLRDAASGKIDTIVVDEPSRLSRQNPIELIETVIAPLRRSGVRIDTASKGPLDYESLAGLIMMTVHAHESEDEARKLSRRTLGGLARKAKDGTLLVGVAPYGLRVARTIDPDSGKVIERKCVHGPEEEIKVVRFIFEAVADRGWSLRRVCRELEQRGAKPPVGNGRGKNKAGGFWNPGTVRKILTNRKYVGDLEWNKVHMGKYSAWRGDQVEANGAVNRRSTRNGPADVIMVPDVIPPLVDRDTFARASAALSRAQKMTSPADASARYLFTHLLVCGDCGSFLRGQPDHGRKGYICANYKEYGTEACHRNTVAEATLKDAILGTVRDDILSPERIEAVEDEIIKRLEEERSSGEADRLQTRADQLSRDVAQGHANLARLPADLLPGVIAQVREWEGERSGIVARLHELENGADDAKKILNEARKQLWRLREAILDDDGEAQAVVVREVISKVEVRFAHEQTHGKRSPAGKGRTLSRATDVILYVRPGLGLSCLVISDSGGNQAGHVVSIALAS